MNVDTVMVVVFSKIAYGIVWYLKESLVPEAQVTVGTEFVVIKPTQVWPIKPNGRVHANPLKRTVQD